MLINNYIESGIVPDNLKIAKIVPIFKAKETHLVKNYRPISLLPVISKILERVVHQNLFSFLNTNKILFPNQYGFRKNHSTTNAVMELVTNIIKAKDTTKSTLSVFLDLSKAFDTLNHAILLRKLEFYGIRGIALKWFCNYLTNRKQFVIYNNESSNTEVISCGVPQGSVLGPLLFLVYINDISNCLHYSKIILFADDATIYISSNNIDSLFYNLNADLADLADWFKANKLALNVNKSNYLLFLSSDVLQKGGDRELVIGL